MLYKTNIPWTVTLSWLKSAYSCPLFRRAISTRKISQTNLVSGVWWKFIERFVHARLWISVCSCYDVCHPSWPKIGFLHL